MKGLLDDFGPIDVVVGADVVLWPQHVEELLTTIKLLLLASSSASFSTYLNIVGFKMIFLKQNCRESSEDRRSPCQCFLSYVVRAASTTVCLHKYTLHLILLYYFCALQRLLYHHASELGLLIHVSLYPLLT